MRVLACLLFAACSAAPHHPGVESLGFDAGEPALGAAHSAADVGRMCDVSKQVLGELNAAALGAKSDADLLAAVGHLDRSLTIATGTVDVLANLHPDAAIRDAARTCESSFNDLATDVMTGPLIARLDKIQAPYAQRIVTSARLSGAGLSPTATTELKKLQARESELTGAMSETVSAEVPPMLVDKARLAGLPDSFFTSHPADANGKIHLDVEADRDSIARYAKDTTLIEELVRARLAVETSNVDRLKSLLEVRHRMAELLGCTSYAECRARTRMVQTPERTAKFYSDLTAMIDELDPPYRRAIGLGPNDRVPEPALKSTEMRARERLGLTSPDPWLDYFEVGPTFERLLAEVGRGTGLDFVAVTVPTWSPDVRVFDVKRGGTRIGRFYFDLYMRPGKVPGAGQSMPFVPRTMDDHDGPVSVVISIGITPGSPALFKPASMIEILMHELGHSIDFLFEKQSSFATSEFDFFDVPSQLFEVWADEPSFLTAIGRKDGKPLPAEGNEAIRNDLVWGLWRYTRFVATFIPIDLAYHGAQIPADLAAVYADAAERVMPVKVDRASHPEADLFIPTIVYAGNGHALPWGLAICSDIAGEFTQGFDDPKTWNRLIDQVLAVDGPATPRIEKFLGRPWNLARLRARLALPLGH